MSTHLRNSCSMSAAPTRSSATRRSRRSKSAASEIRICSDPARRHLQGDQQQIAGGNTGRRQEQARVSRAGDRALCEALRRQALHLESVLSRQHAQPDARRSRGPIGRRIREICRRRFPSYVGRAEEDGRPRSGHEAFAASGLDARKLFARAQDPEVKARLIENTQAAVERGAFGSPTFFVGKEMFFGKEQLREVEELISAKMRHASSDLRSLSFAQALLPMT